MASTVGTLLALVIILLFISATIVDVVPKQQHDAEFNTSLAALQAFDYLRAISAGPVVTGGHFSTTIPLGTPAVSPFAASSEGTLAFSDVDAAGATISFRFVPNFHQGQVRKIDQDVILVMDSSGSMQWNDPGRLRIFGAKEYVGRLTFPDRVAIVDFDSVARLTKANIGREPHHLWYSGHSGTPDYSEAQSDLDTIDSSGNTNIGDALRVANDELLANGDGKHAWVEILLTDGQNNYAWQDALTQTQAQRAKANGIVIYTIGLSSQADAALLTEVATITGGTYYAAPTAESIRWIYFEISRHYQGRIVCGTLSTADTMTGSLSLDIANRQYPSQTLRLEAGGVAVVQSDGATIREGLPFQYLPSSQGSGTLALTLVTYTGSPFSATGDTYAFLDGRVVSRGVEEVPVTKVVLDIESRAVGNISTEVQYWADQGAATASAAYAVRSPLGQAESALLWAHENATRGSIGDAKFNVDRAEAQLSTAIGAAEDQQALKTMQNWLAQQMEDEILTVGCRLDQWQNWYDGVTVTVTSPVASAWAIWFNETFRGIGAPISLGLSTDRALLSIHAVDTILVDRRIIHLSGG